MTLADLAHAADDFEPLVGEFAQGGGVERFGPTAPVVRSAGKQVVDVAPVDAVIDRMETHRVA